MALPAADPYSAVIGAVAGVAKPAPAGPSEAKSSGTVGGGVFDTSGMNVNFGSGGVTSSRTEQSAMSDTMKYVLIGAACVIVLKLMKKL
jgi:hypothetical protein